MSDEILKDYKILSAEITEKLDNTSTYESWLIIQEYIDRCLEENKQLKATLERINNYLDKNYTVENQFWFDHIQDIVKDR